MKEQIYRMGMLAMVMAAVLASVPTQAIAAGSMPPPEPEPCKERIFCPIPPYFPHKHFPPGWPSPGPHGFGMGVGAPMSFKILDAALTDPRVQRAGLEEIVSQVLHGQPIARRGDTLVVPINMDRVYAVPAVRDAMRSQLMAAAPGVSLQDVLLQDQEKHRVVALVTPVPAQSPGQQWGYVDPDGTSDSAAIHIAITIVLSGTVSEFLILGGVAGVVILAGYGAYKLLSK